MPRYFTQKISHEELEQKINSAWKRTPEHDYDTQPCYTSLTKQVEKDLKKVSFDLENMDPWNYKTLDNGLTYLEVVAGGDWEQGVLFIIYWDGSQLRGYIPEEGNLWNTDTSNAYGNDGSDEENMIKRGINPERPDFDFDKIVGDIESRILFKGNKNALVKKQTKGTVIKTTRVNSDEYLDSSKVFSQIVPFKINVWRGGDILACDNPSGIPSLDKYFDWKLFPVKGRDFVYSGWIASREKEGEEVYGTVSEFVFEKGDKKVFYVNEDLTIGEYDEKPSFFSENKKNLEEFCRDWGFDPKKIEANVLVQQGNKS